MLFVLLQLSLVYFSNIVKKIRKRIDKILLSPRSGIKKYVEDGLLFY